MRRRIRRDCGRGPRPDLADPTCDLDDTINASSNNDQHALSKDFAVNMKLTCDEEIDKSILDNTESLGAYLDSNPCASATALLTYFIIMDIEIPRDPTLQFQLIEQIRGNGMIDLSEVLESELIEIQDRCVTQDLDIVFVVDSSGSIGPTSWANATEQIATDWVEEVIRPTYGPNGNHVAMRTFSDQTWRIIDFQDDAGKNLNYTLYAADQIRNAQYTKGMTFTGLALQEARVKDLPNSRNLGPDQTIVFVFTDGASNVRRYMTLEEAEKLKQVATVYSVGIGPTLNNEELIAIATDTSRKYNIDEYDEIDDLMRSMMNSVCGEFDCRNILRMADPFKMTTKGTSQLSGAGIDFRNLQLFITFLLEANCGVGCMADSPKGESVVSDEECIECAEKLAENDTANIRRIKGK